MSPQLDLAKLRQYGLDSSDVPKFFYTVFPQLDLANCANVDLIALTSYTVVPQLDLATVSMWT